MYDELLNNLNLDDLEKEDTEYNDILNLLDNKHLQEELIKEEEQEAEEDFKLESITNIIDNI